MKTIATAIALALSASAFAGKPLPTPTQEQGQIQKQGQGQDQGQQQSLNSRIDLELGSDSSANNEGNTLVAEGDTYDIPVSTAYAPGAYSHIRCDQILGFGATRDDGSMAVGIPMPRAWSRKIKDCERVDTANWLRSMGLRNEEIEMRCETKVLVKKFGSEEECETILKSATNYDAELTRLQNNIDILQTERRIEREKCDESKDRIVAACNK